MAQIVIEGVYENGAVRLAEHPPGVLRSKVVVTFVSDAKAVRARVRRKLQTRPAASISQVEATDPYPQSLRDEYRELIQQKLHRSLTDESSARLDAVRHEIDALDKQTETWAHFKREATEIDQEFADLRRELESLPDA